MGICRVEESTTDIRLDYQKSDFAVEQIPKLTKKPIKTTDTLTNRLATRCCTDLPDRAALEFSAAADGVYTYNSICIYKLNSMATVASEKMVEPTPTSAAPITRNPSGLFSGESPAASPTPEALDRSASSTPSPSRQLDPQVIVSNFNCFWNCLDRRLLPKRIARVWFIVRELIF